MSFKREGSDKAATDSLRARRVKELFAESIPDDEARLCSNGRYACLVCRHNPIFDTINMLYSHRKSNKHLYAAELKKNERIELNEYAMEKQQKLLNSGQKCDIDKIMKYNDFLRKDPNISKLKHSPYDPRCRKKVKTYDRKPTLDLDVKLPSFTHSESTKKEEVYLAPYSSNHNSVLGRTKEATSFCLMCRISKTDCKCTFSSSASGGESSKMTGEEVVEKKKAAEKLLHLRGAGWIKGLDGKWKREEGVEFDSDEEPPDIA